MLRQPLHLPFKRPGSDTQTQSQLQQQAPRLRLAIGAMPTEPGPPAQTAATATTARHTMPPTATSAVDTPLGTAWPCGGAKWLMKDLQLLASGAYSVGEWMIVVVGYRLIVIVEDKVLMQDLQSMPRLGGALVATQSK